MNSKVKYSKELLEEAVRTSTSVVEVIRKIGLRPSGGNHTHIKNRLKKYDIDISHFLGQSFNKGRIFDNERLKPEEILVLDRLNGNRDHAHNLRRALLESGVEHKCEVCGQLPLWNNKPLVLQIDHKNGNPVDNRQENLRFICGNCHLQTENFGIKNKKIANKPI